MASAAMGAGRCVVARGVRAEALLRQGEKDFERRLLEPWQSGRLQIGLLSRDSCAEA